jgi:hypothetical protein
MPLACEEAIQADLPTRGEIAEPSAAANRPRDTRLVEL